MGVGVQVPPRTPLHRCARRFLITAHGASNEQVALLVSRFPQASVWEIRVGNRGMRARCGGTGRKLRFSTYDTQRRAGPMDRPSGFLRRPRRTFRDRREAGRVLAEELASYRGKAGLLVLGLARGGVPVGWEVAAALGAELDVFLVRKLGVPQWSELAMGALASGGGVVMNENVVSSLRISDEQVRTVVEREAAELIRREHAYRGERPVADPRGRTVIVVDDGIATGASILAAVRTLRAAGPDWIVVAVPVGPRSVCQVLAEEADEVVCATMPDDFDAVGQAFVDFHLVSDDEVRDLLATRPGS